MLLIISRYRSYHGASYGAISLTGDPRRPPLEPGIPGVLKVLDPYCYRCPFGQSYPGCGIQCARHVEEVILYENPDTIAAIFVEGWSAPTAYCFRKGQSVIGLLVMNIGNNIGHYGLQRRQLNDGGYERVNQSHTWDSCHLFVNLAALNIARHPDHHMNPGLPCQMLKCRDESPQMPTGYLGMYTLALIPPLWFKVMNPRIEAFYGDRVLNSGGGDLEKA